MKNIKVIIAVFIFLISGYETIAQVFDKKLANYETSIQNLFEDIKKTKNDEDIIKINKEILILFEKALKNRSSFDYHFVKLMNMSKLSSSDEKFKIYTWNIVFKDGTYKYFGFCQFKKNKKAKVVLFKLNDNSESIELAERKILTNKNWFGALYYKLLTNTYKDKTYYTLLAWDGNNDFTNKKIIDVVYINNNEIFFGQPIFKNDNKTLNRVVFEYTKQARMMLKFNEKLKYIVFDHLSPSHKKFEGQYIYYGPDMTYDGFYFKKGFWWLKHNVKGRN